MTILQITLGSGATQFPQLDFQPQVIVFQNNAAAVMRIGDKTVSATKGISLAATGGEVVIPLGQDYSTRMSEFWVFGSSGQVLDVMLL